MHLYHIYLQYIRSICIINSENEIWMGSIRSVRLIFRVQSYSFGVFINNTHCRHTFKFKFSWWQHTNDDVINCYQGMSHSSSCDGAWSHPLTASCSDEITELAGLDQRHVWTEFSEGDEAWVMCPTLGRGVWGNRSYISTMLGSRRNIHYCSSSCRSNNSTACSFISAL